MPMSMICDDKNTQLHTHVLWLFHSISPTLRCVCTTVNSKSSISHTSSCKKKIFFSSFEYFHNKNMIFTIVTPLIDTVDFAAHCCLFISIQRHRLHSLRVIIIIYITNSYRMNEQYGALKWYEMHLFQRYQPSKNPHQITLVMIVHKRRLAKWKGNRLSRQQRNFQWDFFLSSLDICDNIVID